MMVFSQRRLVGIGLDDRGCLDALENGSCTFRVRQNDDTRKTFLQTAVLR